MLTLLIALAVARSSDSYLITLTLMIMSLFCTFRYGYWRISTTVHFFRDPANHWGALDAFFIMCLIAGRVVRLLHSVSRLFSDHLAAAPRPCRAARR